MYQTKGIEKSIAAFAEHAGEYDQLRRRLVPCFDTLYGVAAEIVGLRGGPVTRVLDVGAGTGLLSAHIAYRYPRVRLVLVDGAGEMLAKAKLRLASRAIEIHQQDLRDPLPQGSFDAVVSALAIHHLHHEAQQELFERVHACLRPGGVFVNAEQVAAPTAWLDDIYDEVWRARCRGAGASKQELRQADTRMELDQCTDTQTYLAWMRDAGFVDIDCFFKEWRFAVLAGWRAGA
jgi:tRNA (cmo5U34)-methyltransferase